MKTIYSFRTSRGLAEIKFNSTNNRFHAVFAGEELEHFDSAMQVSDAFATGHAGNPSSGIDTSTLGIPDGLPDWQRAS